MSQLTMKKNPEFFPGPQNVNTLRLGKIKQNKTKKKKTL